MLPPIKIRLPDRNQDMSLHQQSPIKIKIKEIKKNTASNYQIPIKVKICDRDKDMGQSYEKRQAKVREKDGKIVVKYKEDILATDEILEYLSNDYIKPIRIKLSTLDLVYTWLYELIFKFDFMARIEAGMAIVVMYGKFVAKLLFKFLIPYGLVIYTGKPRFLLKFWSSVEQALDIFKVEGLKIFTKFKQEVSGFTQITNKETPPMKLNIKVPAISETIIYDIVPRTVGDMIGLEESQASGDKLGEFVLGQSTLGSGSVVSNKTIEEMLGTDEDINVLIYKKIPRVE